MTESNKQKIFTMIQKIQDLEVANIIAANYPKEDIETIKIDQYTASHFLKDLDKMLGQLKNRLRQPDFHLLPFVLKEDEDHYGKRNTETLRDHLENLHNDIDQSHLSGAVQKLQELCLYQIKLGFWNKDLIKYHPLKESEIHGFQKELELLKAQAEEINKLQKEKLEDIQSTIDKNSKALNEISKNAKRAIENTSQIDELAENAIRNDEKLNGFVTTHEQHVEKIKTRLKEWSDHLQKLGEKGDRLVAEIEGSKENPGLLPQLKENLQKSSEELSFFSETHEYLDQLLASAVGASLFETFAKRKKELTAPVKTWTVVTFCMVGGAVAWIYLVFGNIWFFGDGPEGWIGFALDSLKVLPILLLLGFAVDRFRRERKYQEEYAFKSAVALTIKGYVDLIESKDNKEKLILDSVEGLYRSPVQQKRKRGSDTAALEKLIKDSPELVTKLVSEVLKKGT